MRSLTTIPYLVRGAVVAVVFMIAVGLLFGPAGLRPEPQSAEAAFLSEVKKLLASDAQAFDEFGWRVAVSGDTAVVGARREAAGGSDAGAAYVFQRDEGGTDNWGEVKKLTASDAQAGDNFGESVAFSGDTAIVGAALEDAGGSQAGAAYVFQRDQGGTDNWGEVKKLLASDAQTGDQFGISVAVSGTSAVVGAEFAGGVGAAYVFDRDQGGANNWGEVKKLTASDAFPLDSFGISVAVSGTSAVVGANFEDAGGNQAGAAYVFERDQGGTDNWGEVKKLLASDAQTGDQFGISVAVSGTSAVVGADSAGGVGAAYVFDRDQGGTDNWGEVKKLTASDAQAEDRFGESVAVSGDTAVVGAAHEGANGSGSAYVFQRDQGGANNWGEVAKLTASDAQPADFFGWSVAVSGDTVVGGAYLDFQGGRFGEAYVFDLTQFKPTVTPTPTITPTPTKQPDPGDTDGDGCSDQRENGPDETLGGQRNYKNPNDFYDVAGSPLPPQNGAPDGVIDLPNDILGVIQHHPAGTLGYDVQFDRGPWTGPNSWNDTQGPDGVIDLPNDILGVILQFSHSCQ